jgi:hypothetical protein
MKQSKRLDAMRRNPRADWTIEDVEAVCREHGVRCEPSQGGSCHYKIFYSAMSSKLTVPFRRPINPVYIRQLVEFIDEVREFR